MPFNRQRVKQPMVCPDHGVLLSRRKGQTSDTGSCLDEPPENDADLIRSRTVGSIYITLPEYQNNQDGEQIRGFQGFGHSDSKGVAQGSLIMMNTSVCCCGGGFTQSCM